MFRKIILINIIILSVYIIYSYFSSKSKEDYFKVKLIEKISQKESTRDTFQIKLSDLTNFEWDTLLVAKPYINLRNTNELVGFEWKYFNFQIPNFEFGAWLIFKKENDIVYDFYLDNKFYEYDTSKYYIGFEDLNNMYLHDSSNFKLCYDTTITAKIYDTMRTAKIYDIVY